jgi:predicted aminopeptidase
MVAGFMAGVNVLVLDIDCLRESPEVIASVIVHELCHAQLYARGMTHQFFEQWHEHLASRDQAVFATHLFHAGREADAKRVLQIARLSRNADTSLRARLRRFRENEKRRASVAAPRADL